MFVYVRITKNVNVNHDLYLSEPGISFGGNTCTNQIDSFDFVNSFRGKNANAMQVCLSKFPSIFTPFAI